jgi:hypothetical protein
MSRETDGADRRRLSDHLSKSSSLLDIRMREIEAKLLDPAHTGTLVPKISVKPDALRAGDFAIYDFTYEFDAADSNGVPIFTARLVQNIIFKLHSPGDVTHDQLEAFGSVGVIEIAHPYIREVIHNLTFRMGLPPFVLDVNPPVIDRAE